MTRDEAKLNLQLARDFLAKQELDLAEALLSEIVGAQETDTDQEVLAGCFRCMAEVGAARGFAVNAFQWAESALRIDQEHRHVPGLIEDHELLGRLHFNEDRPERALQELQHAVRFAREAGPIDVVIRAYTNIAFIQRSRGDLRTATRVSLAALRLARDFNRADLMGSHYSMLAAICLSRGQIKRARILLRAA